ncbi:hypothetical protein PS896_03376 [Pseudomonas fluorescens]|jgi:hypothetical protein|uniref:Uncharacterized protein n=1 Tax=Pseudomonas fluorescens TaxID=294 RepID=A0A5E7LIW8_PSEFL|nr:hypothetical protein [Pseudomonas fluorescens]MCP1486474.1 hypothetical protein [Pseudomonas fluorescens]VVP11825.1 hypothetical protein PS896_03376 [Pseudomonas fluorescens]
MLKFKKKIANPMTVIVVFAFISESSAAVSLPFLGDQEREMYIWFLMSFPFYLLLLFFITLNFNYRSLYAPSDFDKDDSFLKLSADIKDTESGLRNSSTEKAPSPEKAKETSSSNGVPAREANLHPSGPPPEPGVADTACSWIEHNVQWPKPLGTLRAIDVRQMNNRMDFDTLLESFSRPGKHSKIIVLLTDPASEVLLMQIMAELLRHAKKRVGATHVIAYNVCTHASTILKGA